MIRINGRNICENCFEDTASAVCPHCGYDPDNNGGDPSMLAPGSVLLGKYVIGQVIGKGGFGITYLAYDTKADKKVAVKEYFPYGIAARSAGNLNVYVLSKENEEAFEFGAEKFYEEAQLISKFNGNPNIVEVYEFFYENNTVYLAMEYLSGRTLKEYIRDHGIISTQQALFIAHSVVNALEAAHSASVLHRDISPDNMVLCENGDVKLIDFGAARQVIAEHSQSFSVILKPGFAPIEQYNKKGNQGPWTDIYSLGATLYFALTGDIPEDPMARFDDDDTFKTNQFGIEPELWTVISKATDMKADKRYRDVKEFLTDLNKINLKPEPIIVSAESCFGQKTSKINAPSNYRQHVSFTADKTEKSFWSRHKSAVIAVCALAAVSAAVIIPVSLNGNKPDDISGVNAPQTGIAEASEASAASEASESAEARITDSEEESASGKFIPEYISPSIYDYKSKVLYNTLSDEDKELYELIYSAIENADIKSVLPAKKYTITQVKEIYQKVRFENPQLGYVERCASEYSKIYADDVPDDEVYVDDIIFKYYDSNASEMEKFLIKDMLALCEFDGDKINNLRKLHDIASDFSYIRERESDAYYDNPYRFLVYSKSDDIGFSETFCYCAQSLGLQSYVVDGTVNGEPHSWCRVKLDETWYNVDIYADRVIDMTVTELEIDNGKRRKFRTFFLVNDNFIKNYGYVPNEEYEFIFDGEYAANSPEYSYYDSIEENAFYIDPNAAYDYILEATAKNFNEGTDKTSCFVPPVEADELYRKLNGQYLSDLKEQYGITPSEFEIKYYPDEFVISVT